MDPAELLPEAATSPHTPLVHIEPRDATPGNPAPPFFATFADDGRSLELLTPTTRENYRARIAATAAPRAC